ncbi:hydroxylase/desaturase CTB9 [Podospora fimiseda]|uniref:Hydroxylase/desaturase CTB9 n=1 Tax=Podospora fimiseda TaxID=252190 RepID=A0AAN6YNB2_9PEZI|nr:hydroxylase/desaturase CTB9 [Podospora fimiseda]
MLTQLRFAQDLEIFQKEVPYEIFGHPTPTSDRITNCKFETIGGVEIQDVRDVAQDYSLNTTGFAFMHHESKCRLNPKDFEKAGNSLENNPAVLAYLEENIELIRDLVGGEKVICCDWRFRRAGAPPSVVPDGLDHTFDLRFKAVAPGYDIHCDFSHRGGWERLELHLLPEELEAVRSGKLTAKIINTWRPFNVVKNAPLILTDRRTILQDDLMEVERVLPDQIQRAYYLKHQPYHRYFYMSDQGPDEVALFTSWDLKKGHQTAEISPHGAASFWDVNYLDHPRESIEVRLIVLSEA